MLLRELQKVEQNLNVKSEVEIEVLAFTCSKSRLSIRAGTICHLLKK